MRRLSCGFLCVCALVLAPAASARFDDGPPLEPFALATPAVGTLTDGFGPRWGRLHAGLDIGILQRPEVVAAADGVVEQAGWLPGYSGYGLVVILRHERGYQTMYAHLSSVGVAVGQKVAAGERLGTAGCTGSCTGTHLHFELHDEGVPVDPMPFLSR